MRKRDAIIKGKIADQRSCLCKIARQFLTHSRLRVSIYYVVCGTSLGLRGIAESVPIYYVVCGTSLGLRGIAESVPIYYVVCGTSLGLRGIAESVSTM